METVMIDEEKQVKEPRQEESNNRPPMRSGQQPRSRVFAVVLGGGLIVALVALGAWLHFRDRVSTDDAEVDGDIFAISAKVSGSIAEVLVKDNQTVKAGEVLVRIDPRDFQSVVAQREADLAVAESQARAAEITVPLTRETTLSGTSGTTAGLATAEAMSTQANLSAEQAGTSELAVAQSNLAAAQANSDKAQADLERMRPLVAKAEISQQQFDAYVAAAKVADAQMKAAHDRVQAAQQTAANSKAAAEAARARVAQMRAELEQSRANQKQVQVTAAQAQSAGARVLAARANLEAAKLNLSYTTIVAPADGVVTKKSIEPGQIIQPGQALFAIIPLKNVWVTANFKETQLAYVHPGQKAEVHVDMYGRTVEGKVDSISSSTGSRMSLLPPENATGNFVKVVQRIPVKIVFDSLPDGVILRPGMNVDATIRTK